MYSQLDPHFSAEAYLNVGLADERRGRQTRIVNIINTIICNIAGDLTKALANIEQCRQLCSNYEQLRNNANRELTRLYLKLAERRIGIEMFQFTQRAYESSIASTFVVIHRFSPVYLSRDHCS
jgi:hypothetical protein